MDSITVLLAKPEQAAHPDILDIRAGIELLHRALAIEYVFQKSFAHCDANEVSFLQGRLTDIWPVRRQIEHVPTQRAPVVPTHCDEASPGLPVQRIIEIVLLGTEWPAAGQYPVEMPNVDPCVQDAGRGFDVKIRYAESLLFSPVALRSEHLALCAPAVFDLYSA